MRTVQPPLATPQPERYGRTESVLQVQEPLLEQATHGAGPWQPVLATRRVGLAFQVNRRLDTKVPTHAKEQKTKWIPTRVTPCITIAKAA